MPNNTDKAGSPTQTALATTTQLEKSLAAYRALAGLIPQFITEHGKIDNEQSTLSQRQQQMQKAGALIKQLLEQYSKQIAQSLAEQNKIIEALFSDPDDNPVDSASASPSSSSTPLAASSPQAAAGAATAAPAPASIAPAPASAATRAVLTTEKLRGSINQQIDAERQKILATMEKTLDQQTTPSVEQS